MPNKVINKVDIFYEIRGEGMPLMLVAGLASDSQSWLPIIEDLSPHCLVVAPDNRGVGRTKPQDVGITIPDVADDCVALVRHLGFSSVNLLGHSMGGFVALDLATRYPDYINKLILAGTAASNSARNDALFSDWAAWLESGMDPRVWFRNIFYWIFSARFFENEGTVNDAVQYAVDYPYPQSRVAFRNQVSAIAGYDCTDGLPRIAAETMVIAGSEDLLFPPQVCGGLAQAIPGATLCVIDNAAHSIHMEQPRAFAESVLQFLLRR